MSEHSAEKDGRLRERILAVIGWFEEVPAKARSHDGSLVGHYVEASDWRVIRSELNQIANALRPIPPAGDPTTDHDVYRCECVTDAHEKPHTRVLPPEECPNADLHETFAGMECGRCGTVIPPSSTQDGEQL